MGAPTVLGEGSPRMGVLYPLVARTASPTPAEFGPGPAQVGIRVQVNTTASAAPSTVFNIEALEPETGTWNTLLASVAIVGNGITTYTIDPRIASAANVSLQAGLAPRMRVRPVHGNGNSHTYAVTVYAYA